MSIRGKKNGSLAAVGIESRIKAKRAQEVEKKKNDQKDSRSRQIFARTE